jgi:hypothetical protein
MIKQQLEDLKLWFGRFAAGYYKDGDTFLNENIRLKECHTHRVCKEMRELAASLKMNESDSILAEAIALFHDVGRFPQFQKYRTYKDTISENHCLMALKVLEEQQLLEALTADEKAIIVKAVEFHGVKEVPPLDERSAHFTRMIRDTDKIDIFTLLVENYRILKETPENFKWELEFPETPECSPAIIEALMNGRPVDYRDLRTINDAKLLQIGWVFDVNFDHSLRQLYQRGYLQAVIDLLPQTGPARAASDFVMSYTKKRLAAVN